MAQQEKGTPSGLELFFQTMLQEIYWCELHLRDVLENMETRASTEELKAAFRNHRAETNDQVTRLEKIFYQRGMGAQPIFCVGMQGLFDEGWQIIDETEEGSAHRDAAMVIAAQKVEHYEIAAYGSLSTLAKTLGFKDAVQLLEESLAEEKKADSILTELAERDINADASVEPAKNEQLSPQPDTDDITTESDPAVETMKEAVTGMDAGAGSASTGGDAGASAPGSADALLVDDSGEPKAKRKGTTRKRTTKK
ncbi:ferritin-like domain-containing protein [Parapedobacter deserti]|uniref:Ferritin-like domain-containing protein n=1 Tax=Parapedobacter deserti TaxID=1912957 RepID=A0ABV7JPT2_9SPHI